MFLCGSRHGTSRTLSEGLDSSRCASIAAPKHAHACMTHTSCPTAGPGAWCSACAAAHGQTRGRASARRPSSSGLACRRPAGPGLRRAWRWAAAWAPTQSTPPAWLPALGPCAARLAQTASASPQWQRPLQRGRAPASSGPHPTAAAPMRRSAWCLAVHTHLRQRQSKHAACEQGKRLAACNRSRAGTWCTPHLRTRMPTACCRPGC